MRKIKVLGIELKDYTVREAMRKTDAFFRDGKASTISYITTKGLITAEENEAVKEFLLSLDMTIAADTDILYAAGVSTRNRLREIENNEFMEEFLKKVVRTKKTVYLLAETTEGLKILENELKDYQEGLRIVGHFSLEDLQADDDFVVNDINLVMPNVIISELSTPRREEFFHLNHMKLNVDIWLMIKDDMNLHRTKKLFSRISTFFWKSIFKRKVSKYTEEN